MTEIEKPSWQRFQPIALEAIKNVGDGYEIYGPPHTSSRYSGDLYDLVTLVKVDDPVD